MSKGNIVRLAGGVCGCRRGVGTGGVRPGPGKEDQDRRRLRPDRPVRRRRLGAAVHRRQDHDRLLHQAGRRRRLQDRAGLCRRPEQARRRHQRGGAPDRAGKGRHGARLLLLGAVRAGGGAVEQLKKFMWITTCISTAVLENKHLQYVFRPQASGQLYGVQATDMIAKYAKSKFGKDPKDLRVAIIHEDGAYGVDVAKGDEAGSKKHGFNVVLKEGYSVTAPDLSALVTKLKRARPDVDLPHRLQPRHHAVAAPGARAGAEVRRAGRPGRGLRRLRQAEGGPGQRRQLLLQHRSDLDLAHQPQDARSEAAAADQDGRRGVRQG